MAGACPPSLSIAVANAGGLGACGALLMPPDAILRWAGEVRAGSAGPFQLNLWVPDPPPHRSPEQEAAVRAFLAQWGPKCHPKPGMRHRPTLRPSARRFWKLDRPSCPRSWASTRRTSCST
ncbi:MAG: hypothetical protein ACJ8H8_24220 [Geminicoccaceae bacterium]